MFKALEHGFKLAQEHQTVHCVVLRGTGRAFCAGLDIAEAASFDRKQAENFVHRHVRPFWDQYLNCEKPVISVVDGPAYGAGAEIALVADIVLASTDAVFGFTGGKVGALCCISGLIGPLTMNGRKVSEMNLTGETINAQQALYYGLVNHVGPSGDLETETSKMLDQMSRVSPVSNSSFKKIRRTLVDKTGMDVAHRELLRTITSDDFKKGAKAFLDKTSKKYY
jgi:enoyl-CoA hydratase/3-hydroxyacyl-CoA dehydrogenase